ncbi:hypothetical protein VUR80DRAFT_3697 [Thermomyces stellatus]
MSTTSVSAPASGTCGAVLYDTPVHDVACAMPYSEDNIDLMSKCCKEADVISYYDNCGLYCLALGQSAEELTDCLYDGGARYEHVFCRDGNDASATATGAEPRESADTEVVKSGDDNDDDGDDGDGDGDDDDEGAAAFTRPSHTTVAGVVIGTLLFTATAFGGIMI